MAQKRKSMIVTTDYEWFWGGYFSQSQCDQYNGLTREIDSYGDIAKLSPMTRDHVEELLNQRHRLVIIAHDIDMELASKELQLEE